MQQFDQDLLRIIEIGKKIVKVCDLDPKSEDISNLILSLMHIERVLDKGRVFLTTDQMENLVSINRGTDELRADIQRLKQSVDEQQFKHVVYVEGEEFKLR